MIRNLSVALWVVSCFAAVTRTTWLTEAFMLNTGGIASSRMQSQKRLIFTVNLAPTASNNHVRFHPFSDVGTKLNAILKDAFVNEENMKRAAEEVSKLTPEDLDRMVGDMENMNGMQKSALKAMGINPEIMKETVKAMKANPKILDSAREMMSRMTPKQLVEQSMKARNHVKSLSPDQIKEANEAMLNMSKDKLNMAIDAATSRDETTDTDNKNVQHLNSKVLDIMFATAQLMSSDTEGEGVSLSGFASLPVIQMLAGGDNICELTMEELKECWDNGSQGAKTVDRNGFQRVWLEVQDYFEDDIVAVAREEANTRFDFKPLPETESGSNSENTASTLVGNKKSVPASPTPATPRSKDDVQTLKAVDRARNLSATNFAKVLQLLENPGEAELAHLNKMGIDPGDMENAVKMLKNNPAMQASARKMLANLSPEEIMDLSRGRRK